MKIYPPIAVPDEDAEYTCMPLADPGAPIIMTEEEQALYRAWDALQAYISGVMVFQMDRIATALEKLVKIQEDL